MAWETIFEMDQIQVRIDKTGRDVVLEVNSGGLIADYVTLHLGEVETEGLIKALNTAKSKAF